MPPTGGCAIFPALPSALLRLSQIKAFSLPLSSFLTYGDILKGSELYLFLMSFFSRVLLLAGRITEEEVSKAVKSLSDSMGIRSYVCGPTPLISCMEGYLRSSGLADSQINCEKWW